MAKAQARKRRSKRSAPPVSRPSSSPSRRQGASPRATANRRMAAGDYAGALTILEQLQRQQPRNAAVLDQLAECLHALGRPTGVLECRLRRCELTPQEAHAHYALGIALRELRRRDEAHESLCRAVALDPAHRDALVALFHADEKANRLDQARHWLDRLAQQHPADRARPFLEASWWARRDDYERALAELAGAPSPTPEDPLYPRWTHLLGKLQDKTGRYAEAFEAFAATNAYHLRSERDVEERISRYLERAQRPLTALAADDYGHWATGAEQLPYTIVWQVGFPRSGTTLIDRLLDSHPDITVLSEVDTTSVVISLIDQLPGAYPGGLDRLDDELAGKLRQVYLAVLAKHCGALEPGRVYVDKTPLNTLHLPLLARLLPQAKVLFSSRHPADVVLSAFMQHFKLNDAMACFLRVKDAVALYDTTMRCAAHFERVFPFQRKRVVSYESLVEDLEGQARALLDFLEVPWNPVVLAYHEHAARHRVDSTSYDQVIKPVYANAVGRWQHYRACLEPWLATLAPHARRLGYDI